MCIRVVEQPSLTSGNWKLGHLLEDFHFSHVSLTSTCRPAVTAESSSSSIGTPRKEYATECPASCRLPLCVSNVNPGSRQPRKFPEGRAYMLSATVHTPEGPSFPTKGSRNLEQNSETRGTQSSLAPAFLAV